MGIIVPDDMTADRLEAFVEDEAERLLYHWHEANRRDGTGPPLSMADARALVESKWEVWHARERLGVPIRR